MPDTSSDTPAPKGTGPEAILTFGWEEWVSLPDLGLPAIRAKVDTGARTSALHAVDQRVFEKDHRIWVRFVIPIPNRRRGIRVEAPVIDERDIKNTGGVPERRLIVRTALVLGRHHWHIDVSLANREKMEFGDDEFNQIDAHCKALGIPWVLSVRDVDSLAYSEKWGLPAIKIGTSGPAHWDPKTGVCDHLVAPLLRAHEKA